MEIEPVAFFRSPFATKFGIPKQSGLADTLRGTIEFVPKYRNADALRGMEDFDYLWLVWEFSANRHEATSPVVRPPRLGGNTKIGVFATRSPFRPNRLGLSSVRIDRIDYDAADGPRRRQVRNDTLKWVLSEVLRDMREQKRCLVKYEVKQGCFHITVN